MSSDTPPFEVERFCDQVSISSKESDYAFESDDPRGKTLRRGVSIAIIPQTKATKEQIWAAKLFRVRAGMLPDIWMRLRVRADIDVLGTAKKTHFPFYWGKKAWSRNWGDAEGILFINASVNDIYDCIRKVRRDQAKAVAVVPDWREESWFHMIWPMTVRYHFYPAHAALYENDRPSWGSWAVYLNGATTMSGGEDLKGADNTNRQDKGFMKISAQEVQRNASSRRNYRRKTLRKYKKQQDA